MVTLDPATTDAADKAAVPGAIPFRAVDATVLSGSDLGVAPTVAARVLIALGAGKLGAGGMTFAAVIVGKAAVELTDAERGTVPGGGGTRGGLCLAGSSKQGGGKIGFAAARPVPDGTPPPTRRRGALPAAAPAALRACSTICCWRARTSRPLVT